LTTCDYVTLVVPLLPSHDAVIPEVSNKQGAIVIHDETVKAPEFLKATSPPVNTRNSDPVL
jgi:hypothetical protein